MKRSLFTLLVLVVLGNLLFALNAFADTTTPIYLRGGEVYFTDKAVYHCTTVSSTTPKALCATVEHYEACDRFFSEVQERNDCKQLAQKHCLSLSTLKACEKAMASNTDELRCMQYAGELAVTSEEIAYCSRTQMGDEKELICMTELAQTRGQQLSNQHQLLTQNTKTN